MLCRRFSLDHAFIGFLPSTDLMGSLLSNVQLNKLMWKVWSQTKVL